MRIDAGTDFADLFEVKDALAKKGDDLPHVEGGRLVLGYTRERYVRETWITASATPGRSTSTASSFGVQLEPHGELDDLPRRGRGRGLHRARVTAHSAEYGHGERRGASRRPAASRSGSPTRRELDCDWHDRSSAPTSAASSISRRCASIRAGSRTAALPAAGLPWFMALFGRDSLITSFQALPFAPELAADDAARAGAPQGTRDRRLPRRASRARSCTSSLRRADRVRGAAALALLRRGRRDAALPDPARRVRALDRRRRAGARARARGARGARVDRRVRRPRRRRLRRVRAAQHRDRAREPVLEGLVELDRRSPTARSRRCRAPTCEIQGYVYDAKVRCARLAREVWDDADAGRAARTARRPSSSSASTDDFWLADREFFALALDGDKRQVDSLTSNIGHLLWSGIVDDDKAEAGASAPDGRPAVLGLGRAHDGRRRGGYNPIGYHVGTVWPHDNSFIAPGCAATAIARRPRAIAVGDPRGGDLLPRPAARGVRRLPARARPASRSSTRPRAARRRGPPARRCCSSAPCSVSNRTATSSAPIRTSPRRSESSRSRVSPAAGARRTPEEWGRPRRPRRTWPS